jgi:hypothetical protein
MPDKTEFFKGLIALAVALIGGYVGYLYRDSFDGPKINVDAIHAEPPYNAIHLSRNALQAVTVDGNLQKYVEDRVTWSFSEALKNNSFEYRQLGDLVELLPKFSEEFNRQLAQRESYLATVSAAPVKVGVRNQELDYYLCLTRKYFLDQFKKDIFAEYEQSPQETVDLLKRDLNGDIQQSKASLVAGDSLFAQVQNLRSAGPPDVEPIIGGIIPNVIITAIVSNTGRSAALLRNSAVLSGVGWKVTLIGYNKKIGTRERANRYNKVESYSVTEITFAFDLDLSVKVDMERAYAAIRDNRGEFSIEVKDVSGEQYSRDFSEFLVVRQ